MSDPIVHPQSRQHNLADWLDLHGLDHKTCFNLLDEISRESSKIPADRANVDPQFLSVDTDGAWTDIVSAMCRLLPDHQAMIDDTFLRSTKIAITGQGKSRKALTIDHGPAKYPTIMYNYSGEISDLLVVSHEFGHALQIRASEGIFMPPVMREVCAFIAEEAIFSSCSEENSDLAASLQKYWQKSNQRYFGILAEKFRNSLGSSENIYDYSWNYPVARLLALRISSRFPRDSIWGVFRGDYSIKRILEQLAE